MKKLCLLFSSITILLFTGCGAADHTVSHQDGNLIITNYATQEITNTTITHLGQTIAVSPDAIQDTQICYFSIDPADDYVYTVSFVDQQGKEHAREFTDDFTKDAQILIAIRYDDTAWTIDYDN